MQSDSSPCPDEALLRQLVRGGVDESSVIAFEEHLQSCPNCSGTIDSILDESDTCVRELARQPLREEDEADFRRLYQSLLSDPEPFATTIGSTLGTHADANPARDRGTSRSQPPHIELPFVVSEYELFELLGRGAHGSVYKARHRKLDRLVAVKLLRRRSVDDATTDPFLDEMRAIGRLDHPNIIRATDAGESGEWYYLAMEYQPGTDVSSLIQQPTRETEQYSQHSKSRLSIADACEIARQAALALDCVAERRLVHRDIKPSNLLLTREGHIKLLDLGLVALPAADDDSVGEEVQQPRGTANYMSPEQWQNYGQVDIRADLYSLGCTLYKLLVGYTPFHAHGHNRREAHCQAKVTPLREIREDVPESLDRLVQRLLEKSPNDRVQTPGELVSLLQPFCGRANLPALLTTNCDGSRTLTAADELFNAGAGSRRRFLWGAFGAVAVAVVGSKISLPKRNAGLRYGQWRTLAPQPPFDLPVGKDKARIGEWQLPPQQSGELHFVADQTKSGDLAGGHNHLTGMPAMLNLGQPISGEFALQVALGDIDQLDATGSCGLFFGYRDARQNGHNETEGIRFQSIEWSREDGVPTVIWSETRIDLRVNSDDMTQRVVLAGAEILDSNSDKPCQLLVELGQQGFPRVVWNDAELGQSLWTVSFEGRTQSAVPKRLLHGEYQGRVGLIVRNTAAYFRHPQLKYLA